ncbi:MAG: FkbM family methyltransferase [Paracoccaceae bacterium]|nr:FkbM family methyltransferase [Paracoccaceae bacterium]
MLDFKESVRRWMPRPIWVLLRRISTYIWRLGHWVNVLREARGDGTSEAIKLYASAIVAPITALTDLDLWLDPQLCFDVKIRVNGSDRFLCRRGLDDLWHVLPSAQGGLREVLADRLHPGGVFVDAGANIGGFTVFGARRVGPDGQVVAIEMMPETASRLHAHLVENGLNWVQVVEEALSDMPGREIIATMPRGLPGQTSIIPREPIADRLENVPVRTTTLDIVTRELPQIDVLKVDLEGAEALAFKGGAQTLSRTRCIIFEDWGEHGDNTEATEICSRAGFTLRRLDGNNLIGLRQSNGT